MMTFEQMARTPGLSAKEIARYLNYSNETLLQAIADQYEQEILDIDYQYRASEDEVHSLEGIVEWKQEEIETLEEKVKHLEKQIADIKKVVNDTF